MITELDSVVSFGVGQLTSKPLVIDDDTATTSSAKAAFNPQLSS